MPGRGRGVRRKARNPTTAKRQCIDLPEAPESDENTDIWLCGDSIVHWAGVQAVKTGKPDLKLDKKVGWYGIRGMSWSSFIHSLQLKIAFQKPPSIFMIHLGGNDVSKFSLCRIFNLISKGLNYVASTFPECVIIWCDILPRLNWGTGQIYKKADGKRRRINRFGRQKVLALPKGDVLSIDIDTDTPGFYRLDGVHLSLVGLEYFLDALKDKLVSRL
ncbi:uncharacterized protein LOC123552767 isoform X2 [Mercenaria mercenaria]|uniref:uncharacterized protein LOC123552767 isoform X2 n=1 Tax=Mercenaria mercenaria TaxID=6596 RepID=UPI00234E42AF|nr:uncharacterized protein LOC123552767 isoform X2 [Mercenaria mercenaria]